MRIAIIGAGISGNLAARLLSTRHHVTLFEASNYAGGHTNTITVRTPEGLVPVDTGFMVFNRPTYPNFCRMLELLRIESQPSDMSFSVHAERTGVEYNGSSLNGLFAQRANLLRPRFLRLVRDILRFNAAGQRHVSAISASDRETMGDFFDRYRLGPEVQQLYLLPMLAAIWSAAPESVRGLPAKFILGFMHNHGLMQLRDRPQWRTVVEGARNYVQRLLGPLGERVRLATPIARVQRRFDGVTVFPQQGAAEEFDAAVLATHADQSLAMLDDASHAEREILSAFPYQPNTAVLHSDPSPMPASRRAWASWNYRLSAEGMQRASVTYDLNRLQQLTTAQPIFVTLNPVSSIDPKLVHRTIAYRHPSFSLRSVAAQRRWEEINGTANTWYCGAYWGYGFHEDGVNSALRVAKAFGIELEDLKKDVPIPAMGATTPPVTPSTY